MYFALSYNCLLFLNIYSLAALHELHHAQDTLGGEGAEATQTVVKSAKLFTYPLEHPKTHICNYFWRLQGYFETKPTRCRLL